MNAKSHGVPPLNQDSDQTLRRELSTAHAHCTHMYENIQLLRPERDDLMRARDDVTRERDDLARENEVLSNKLTLCCVCNDCEICTLLLQCSHLILCRSCSRKAASCPISKAEIEEKNEVFIG